MTTDEALTVLLDEALRPAHERITGNGVVRVRIALRQLAPKLADLANAMRVEAGKKASDRATGMSLADEMQSMYDALNASLKPAMPLPAMSNSYKWADKPAPPHHSVAGLPSADAVEKAGPSDARFGVFVRKHLAEPHGAGRGGESVAVNRSWYERLRDAALKAAQGAL